MSDQGRYLPLVSTTLTTGKGFLSVNDITDSMARDFITANDSRVQNWLDDVDGEVLALAQELEVPLTSFTMPLHKKVLEYCQAYYCFNCFQDVFGRNDVSQSTNETLKLKLDWYANRVDKLKSQITKEMLLYTNLSLQSSQRARGTVSLLRG